MKIFLSTIFVIIIGTYFVYLYNIPQKDTLYIFSLKNEKAVFVNSTEGKRYLIDGGPNGEIIRKITKIIPFYSRHIDGVILTDTDKNKINGLIDVIHRYRVGNLYLPSQTKVSLGISSSTNEVLDILLSEAKDKNIQINYLGAGDRLEIDKIHIEILFPVSEGFEYSASSHPELVYRVVSGSRSIFVAGGITKKIQKTIMERPNLLNSDVLITDFSLNEANIMIDFLRKISPNYMIYSSGSIKKDSYNKVIASIMPNNVFNIKEGDISIEFENDSLKLKKSP